MSTVIGKNTFPAAAAGPPAGAAREVTRQTDADRDGRAARFRAALGQKDGAPVPGPQCPGLAQPQAGKAGKSADRFTLQRQAAQPPGADRNKPTTPQHSAAGAGQAAQREKEREPAFHGKKPPFFDDQVLLGAGNSAQAGVAAVAGKGCSGQGGAGAGGFADELALTGPGGATALEKDAKTKAPGEAAIADVAAAVSAAATIPVAHHWARPEGPTHAPPRARDLPQPMSGDPVHQLLIGKGPSGTEARMVISVGPLAGTTIHLKEGPGGIQAAVLTQTATARQTLSSAMGAAAQRLKTKGHRLEVRFEDSGRAGESPFEQADNYPFRG